VGGKHARRSARLAAHRGRQPFEVLTHCPGRRRVGVVISLALKD